MATLTAHTFLYNRITMVTQKHFYANEQSPRLRIHKFVYKSDTN
jgi:hypothetical protein